MRLFIAAGLDAAAKEEIRKLQLEWKEKGMKARWIPEENFHLTLAFIGESSQASVRENILSQLPMPEISLKFSRAGHFKDLYWIAPEPDQKLEEYVRKLRARLRNAGIPLDSKPFRAHITLARKAVLPPEYELMQPEFQARLSEAVLMESVLRPAGPVYRAVKK